LGKPRLAAAWVKLASSATRAKASMASSGFMGRIVGVN
jgi:hypothetical protein